MFIYARLKIKLFVFVCRKQATMAPFWKGDAMRYCAAGNVDRTFCLKPLSTKQTFDLFFLISVTSNHGSHIKYVHTCICKDCNSKFVEMHVDASDIYPSALVQYFILDTRLILRSIELFIYIQTCVSVNAYPIKK